MAHSDSTVPLPPSTREARGLELYRRGGIERIARDVYVVPACSTRSDYYRVRLDLPACTCKDFQRHAVEDEFACKHVFAALVYRAHLRRVARTVAPVLADDRVLAE